MGLSFTIFKQFVFSLVFFNFMAANFTSSMLSPLCHDDERSALLQFKESLIINETYCRPKTASWKPKEGNIDCCLWDGVQCNQTTGRVIKLDLSNSCLRGSINSSSGLFKLVHLEWLNLAFNDFNSSEIPAEIINLSRLSYLNLSYSSFSGQIPSEILELSDLVSLDLSANSYYYPVERKKLSLGNLVEKLTNLNELALAYVRISSPIPNSLANLSSLTFLSLSECELQGKISSSLSNLTKLTHLDLSFNKLSGELPTFIGNLDSLKKLHLSANDLSGELPTSIANLASLELLGLSFNRFQGKVPPSLGNLTQLYFLNLGSNDFLGELPASFGKLRSLEHLDVSECKFSSQIPSSLSNLTQLITLDFSQNSFSGTMDLDMFLLNLKHLEILFLSSNRLSLLTKITSNTTSQKFVFVGLRSCNLTQFPHFLKNQHHLQLLDLSSNIIHGNVPKWLLDPSMKNLSYLNLSHNFLKGFDQHPVVFPCSCPDFTLDLRSNHLQGPLPVPPNKTLSYLVSNNNLIGEIPTWICNLTSLKSLDLSHNNLSGLLPQCLGNFSNRLLALDLQHNKFSGSIPQSFLSGKFLTMIDLSDNLLQGRIPRSLVNCSLLEFLDLGNNQISDTFPSWLGTLPYLNVLILKSNKLHGVIREPKTQCGFPKLLVIDLSNNRFTGKLPSKYFHCWSAMQVVNASKFSYMHVTIFAYTEADSTYDYSLTISNKGQTMSYSKIPFILTGIVLSSNRFDGEIPTSISNLKGLQILSLANNSLHGHIPSCLGNLTGLESLDLSNNRFSGQIPQQLVDLTFLEFFNVSHNNLTGPIPKANQFPTFDNTSFDGNSGLCGKPLSKQCETSEAPTNEDHFDGSGGSFFSGVSDWKIILIGYAGGLIVGVVIGLNFSTGILEWFLEKFGMQSKRRRRMRRARNRT